MQRPRLSLSSISLPAVNPSIQEQISAWFNFRPFGVARTDAASTPMPRGACLPLSGRWGQSILGNGTEFVK